MKLLNIFKKKKKPAEKLKKEKKEKVEKEEIKSEIKEPKKKIAGGAYKVLVSHHITEKATELEKENKYVFKVFQETNKIEIKKAIEGLYGVEVINIKIINVPRRRKRLGRQEGWKKGYKKAIVKVKKGQKIEIMSR